MEQRAASPRTIARIFGCSPRRVYEAIQQGHVQNFSSGRASMVFVEDFERYVRSLPPTRSPSKGVPHAA